MNRLLLITITALSTLPALAADPVNISRTQEAANACGQYIIANAKDPGSIQFDENFTFGFGRVVTKNHVYIGITGVGKNTYGAVLRHTFNCDAVCKQGQSCQVIEVRE